MRLFGDEAVNLLYYMDSLLDLYNLRKHQDLLE